MRGGKLDHRAKNLGFGVGLLFWSKITTSMRMCLKRNRAKGKYISDWLNILENVKSSNVKPEREHKTLEQGRGFLL